MENLNSSKFERRVAGVERSEPPVRRVSGGSPTNASRRRPSTPVTLAAQIANFELLSLVPGLQRFMRLHAILALPGSPPRTSAESDQRFDALEESGKPVSLPRARANGTSMLAEIWVEPFPAVCIFSHLYY